MNPGPKHTKPWQFGIRSLLAFTSGIAFVAFAIRWLLSLGVTPFNVAFVTLPWAIGSLSGIVLMARRNRSTVAGGISGGAFGAFAFYCIDMLLGIGLTWQMEEVIWVFGFAMCGGGILAGTVSVVLEGFSVSRRPFLP